MYIMYLTYNGYILFTWLRNIPILSAFHKLLAMLRSVRREEKNTARLPTSNMLFKPLKSLRILLKYM